ARQPPRDRKKVVRRGVTVEDGLGSKTTCPILRAPLSAHLSAKMDLRIIFVVFDLPVRVMPNNAVFWPKRSSGDSSTGMPLICWKGRLLDAYRTSPMGTRTSGSAWLRGSRKLTSACKTAAFGLLTF